MVVRYLAAALLCCIAFVSPVHAHHSAAGYNQDATASVTGTVSRLVWRNPHVIIELDVTNEEGDVESWALESAGLQDLIADGWTREAVGSGETITVEVFPTVRGNPGGIIRWVTLADGRVLPRDPASPTGVQVAMVEDTGSEMPSMDPQERLQASAQSSLDDYLENREEFAKWEEGNRPEQLPIVENPDHTGALDPDNLAAHEGVAVYDFTGIWKHRGMFEYSEEYGGKPWDFLPMPELTPKAQAVRDDILARREAGDASADPATFCYPHGLLRSMTRAGNMMLYQVNTALFMNHRMNNDFRGIYWDGRDHVPADVRIDSYNGDSIAYWADDHLYVETVGFGQPFTWVNAGVPMGQQAKVIERWRLINDGNTLEIEFRMTDPEHWVGEWVVTRLWDRTTNADILEANCIYALDGVLSE